MPEKNKMIQLIDLTFKIRRKKNALTRSKSTSVATCTANLFTSKDGYVLIIGYASLHVDLVLLKFSMPKFLEVKKIIEILNIKLIKT